MDVEKVKLIIRSIELLIDNLKVEVYGKEEYSSYDDVVYEEDDEDFEGRY